MPKNQSLCNLSGSDRTIRGINEMVCRALRLAGYRRSVVLDHNHISYPWVDLCPYAQLYSPISSEADSGKHWKPFDMPLEFTFTK